MIRNGVQEHPNKPLEEALMEKLVDVTVNIDTRFIFLTQLLKQNDLR
jgi:hypothetical protein